MKKAEHYVGYVFGVEVDCTMEGLSELRIILPTELSPELKQALLGVQAHLHGHPFCSWSIHPTLRLCLETPTCHFLTNNLTLGELAMLSKKDTVTFCQIGPNKHLEQIVVFRSVYQSQGHECADGRADLAVLDLRKRKKKDRKNLNLWAEIQDDASLAEKCWVLGLGNVTTLSKHQKDLVDRLYKTPHTTLKDKGHSAKKLHIVEEIPHPDGLTAAAFRR